MTLKAIFGFYRYSISEDNEVYSHVSHRFLTPLIIGKRKVYHLIYDTPYGKTKNMTVSLDVLKKRAIKGSEFFNKREIENALDELMESYHHGDWTPLHDEIISDVRQAIERTVTR